MLLRFSKFEETDSMKSTVNEAIALMDAYDVNGDNSLDPAEFVLFMVQFAKMAEADLDDTLDFMIATSAMTWNNEEDLEQRRKGFLPSKTESGNEKGHNRTCATRRWQ